MIHPTVLSRRGLLLGATAWAALANGVFLVGRGGVALAGDGEAFSPDNVAAMAKELAQSEFARPTFEGGAPFDSLSAEQYRDIHFRSEKSVWRGDAAGVEVQLLARGWIFETPVAIRIVEGGRARRLRADSSYFTFGPLITEAPEAAPYAFSGFRLMTPLDRSDVSEACAVFQGASYFRAIGRGQTFGLSARGLAVDTAQPSGEEFPIFRAFWIEKPLPASREVVVHALLDSRSVAGAYRFVIRPGDTTIFEVSAKLFPRRRLTHIGIAPLTSMYLRGTQHRRANGDLRPSVHNSEGLSILNGNGERLWRPLTNPRTLQTSAFIDRNPRGFGLMQRDRSPARFEDLAARFEKRPSVWIEPRADWGDGYVELIEIPSDEEIHDNIVAYWTPGTPVEPGTPYEIAYRIHWGEAAPVAPAPALVAKTLVAGKKKENTISFAVDFAGPATNDLAELPQAEISSSAGAITGLTLQRHPDIGGLRVSFDLAPNGNQIIELRLQLRLNGQVLSESWLYRWTS